VCFKIGLNDILDTTAWDQDPHLARLFSHLKLLLVVVWFFLIEFSLNASDHVEQQLEVNVGKNAQETDGSEEPTLDSFLRGYDICKLT